MSIKLESILFKVSLILNKESLKGSFISFIRAKLIYLIKLSLLSSIKVINLLLKSFNLINKVLSIKVIIINIKESKSLKYYYILILLN